MNAGARRLPLFMVLLVSVGLLGEGHSAQAKSAVLYPAPPTSVSRYRADLNAGAKLNQLTAAQVAQLAKVTNKNELYTTGCHSPSTAPGANPNDCVFANPEASKSMWLIGDSHAAMWFPAVKAFALSRGLKLVVYTKSSCPILSGLPANSQTDEPYTACIDYNDWILERLTAAKLAGASPNLVLVVGYQGIQRLTVFQSGIGLSRLSGLAEHIVALQDSPKQHGPLPVCLKNHSHQIKRCAVSPAMGYYGVVTRELANTARDNGFTFVEARSWFCTNTTCPPVIAGRIMYADVTHITTDAAIYLSNRLKFALDSALNR